MYKRTVTFRETTLKTIEVVGEDAKDIERKIQAAMDEPSTFIDFEKEPDSYNVDATFISGMEEIR